MAKQSLTQKRLESMRVGEELSDSGDHRGLRVTRTPAGTRFWYRRNVTENGKTRKKAHLIGYLGEITLAEARAGLLELKSQARSGVTPTMPEPEAEPVSFTVAQLVEEYLEHLKPRRRAKGWHEVRRVLTRLLVEPLGVREVDDVSGDDVLRIAQREVLGGRFAQAGVFCRECRAAWNLAIYSPDRKVQTNLNPGEYALGALKAQGHRTTSKRRQRYLTDGELKKLLAWMPQSGFSAPQRTCLDLTLRTGCRTGEAVSARWNDIDLESGIWNQVNVKNEVPRELPLAPSTTAWLRTVRAETQGDYVCPSTNTRLALNQQTLTSSTCVMRKEGTMVDIAPWTPHDLRRSVRTGLSKLGCPREVGEALLNHVAPGVVGVYEVYSYFEEIRHWLTVWNDHLDSLRPKPQLRAVV